MRQPDPTTARFAGLQSDADAWSSPSLAAPDPACAFEQAPVALATCDAQSGRHLAANAKYRELLGYPLDELRDLSLFQLTHRDDREAEQRALHSLRSGAVDLYERRKRMVCRSGSMAEVTARVGAMADEVPVRVVSVALLPADADEDRLRHRSGLLGSRFDLLQAAPVGFAEADPVTLALVDANPAMAAILGRPHAQVAELRLEQCLAPSEYAPLVADAGALVRGDIESSRRIVRLAATDAPMRSIDLQMRYLEAGRGSAGNAPSRLLLTAMDVTALQQAERAVQSLAQARQTLFDLSHTGMVEVDVASGLIVRANDAFRRMLDPVDASDLEGLPYAGLLAGDGHGSGLAPDSPMAEAHAAVQPDERRYLRRDGGLACARIASAALPSAAGRLDSQLIAAADVSASREMSRQAGQFARLIGRLFELESIGVLEVDPSSGRILRANGALCEALGFAPGALQGQPYVSLVHPEHRTAVADWLDAHAAGRADTRPATQRFMAADGRTLLATVDALALRPAPDAAPRVLALLPLSAG